jgi:caffeoyl-CoA O-methyltransferase
MADLDSRAGASYTTPEILAYVAETHARHDSALADAFAAPLDEAMPPIQVGPSEGKALEILLKLVSARKVVEVGTLAGYSAIRMARALPSSGHLFTIEHEPRHAEVARKRIEAAGLTARVTVLVGAALDVLPTLVDEGPFDACFIDADKGNYDQYGRWAAANVRAGGLLLGDNAFLFGRLLEQSPEAAAMRRFHEEAALHFDTVCLPTPDGLLLGVRRGEVPAGPS